MRYCNTETGYEESVVKIIGSQFSEDGTRKLSTGHTVDLGEDFGIFSVKLRTDYLEAHLPRIPKESCYKAIFRDNNGMKRRLGVKGEGRRISKKPIKTESR